jgi:hypothetical protein
VPGNTTLRDVGPDGSSDGELVTWTRAVTLALGESTLFTFSVDIGDVPSGTVISNENYGVAASFGVTTGQPYTVTVVDPILLVSKKVCWPAGGSNREMTYTHCERRPLATGIIVDRVLMGSAGAVAPMTGAVVEPAEPGYRGTPDLRTRLRRRCDDVAIPNADYDLPPASAQQAHVLTRRQADSVYATVDPIAHAGW